MTPSVFCGMNTIEAEIASHSNHLQSFEKDSNKQDKFTHNLPSLPGYFDRVSYGVVLRYKDKFLIAQRRNTIAFVDFVLGRYRSDYLSYMFCLMTREEKSLIMKNVDNYDNLWKDLIGAGPVFAKRKALYRKGSQKFKQHKEYLVQLCHVNTFKTLEWMFPKGRKKNIYESELKCALRELREEVGVDECDVVLDTRKKPITEIYNGSDKLVYQTIYYLFNLKRPLYFKKTYYSMLRPMTLSDEVKQVRWVTLEESRKYLTADKYCILEKFSR